MAVMTDKKLWPFFILQVMKDHSEEGSECDEEGNRYLTRKQIISFLKDEYGIETQRKAITDNLNRLHEAGLLYPELGFELEYVANERNVASDATSEDEKQTVRQGWRLVQNYDFEASEIRMLIDGVIASPVVPPKQARMLIERLKNLSPHKIMVPNIEREAHLPAVNSEYFYNIELLNEAIDEKKKVRFVLGAFSTDGKLHDEQHDGIIKEYTVVPIQLLISNGHYFLLSRFPDSEDVYKFRIELMKGVEILDDADADDLDSSKINVLQYRERHSYTSSGDPVNVVLRVSRGSLHSLFDQFGPNVQFVNKRKDTVDVRLKSALYSVLFWALKYYRYVEVVSPPELREKLEVAGQVITEMYAGEPGAVGLEARQAEALEDCENV